MRPRPRPLPADEIAVGGRGAALLRRHLVGVHREAHRAARPAPFKARFNEDTYQPFLFRLPLDPDLARTDQHLTDIAPDLATVPNPGRGAMPASPTVRPATDHTFLYLNPRTKLPAVN